MKTRYSDKGMLGSRGRFCSILIQDTVDTWGFRRLRLATGEYLGVYVKTKTNVFCALALSKGTMLRSGIVFRRIRTSGNAHPSRDAATKAHSAISSV